MIQIIYTPPVTPQQLSLLAQGRILTAGRHLNLIIGIDTTIG